MRIEQWSRGDDEAVATLEKICFKYPWSAETVSQTASSSNFFGVVAKNESDDLTGYAGAIYALDSADIALVAVAPEYRRHGYAFALLKSLLNKLFSLGVKTVYLEVRVGNIAARELYSKLGFKPVGIRKKYYEDFEDALVMARELPFE